jgi:hypothetical protein
MASDQVAAALFLAGVILAMTGFSMLGPPKDIRTTSTDASEASGILCICSPTPAAAATSASGPAGSPNWLLTRQNLGAG